MSGESTKAPDVVGDDVRAIAPNEAAALRRASAQATDAVFEHVNAPAHRRGAFEMSDERSTSSAKPIMAICTARCPQGSVSGLLTSHLTANCRTASLEEEWLMRERRDSHDKVKKFGQLVS